MKILFVAPFSNHGRDILRKDLLIDQGHDIREVRTFRLERPPTFLGKLPERILWRLRLPLDATGANPELLRIASDWRPEIAWIEKGVTIYPWTLRKLRNLCPRTRIVGYQEDNLYVWWHWSAYFRLGVKYYDVIFTTKASNCTASEFPAWGARRTVLVPQSFDPRVHRPVPLSAEDLEQYGSDIVFAGRYEPDRADAVQFLASKGLRVRVWGDAAWSRLKPVTPDLRVVNRPALGDDYAKVLCASKIALNFLSKIVPDQSTTRSVEIPACGAFMLSERTEEHSRLFREDEEAVFFSSFEEMLLKARKYLDDDPRRRQIAAAGLQRCISSGYGAEQRLRQIIESIKELE